MCVLNHKTMSKKEMLKHTYGETMLSEQNGMKLEIKNQKIAPKYKF